MTQQAREFEDCFICDKRLINTFWYHNACYDNRDGKIGEVIRHLSYLPEAIPKSQHYRYIRRIYLGKKDDTSSKI